MAKWLLKLFPKQMTIIRPIACALGVILLLGANNTCLADDKIAVGDNFAGLVKFSGRNWPMLPGAWQVAAHVPYSLPTGEVAIDQVMLVQLEERRVKAFVVLSASDPHISMPQKTALPGCDDQYQFRSYKYNTKDGSQDCWYIKNEKAFAAGTEDPVTVSARAWLKAQDSGLPKHFTRVSFYNMSKTGFMQAEYSFDPAFYFADKDIEQPNHIPSLSDITMLREWAISWHKIFKDTLNGSAKLPPKNQPYNESSVVFLPPSLGLKANQVFKDFVPIGPLRVPLPPGDWEVISLSPTNGSDGQLALDGAVLAHIVNKKLDGMVVLEQSVGDTVVGGMCHGRPAIHETAEDEFCAAQNGYENDDPVKLEHDYAKLALAKLKSQGIETYNQLAGGYFGFTNHLSSISVYILYSPSHLGLPDHNYGAPIPQQWLNVNGDAWLSVWTEAVKAGLKGNFRIKSLQDPATRPDLGTKAKRPANTNLKEAIENTVTLNGTTIPLPPGKWEVLANVPESNSVGDPRFDDLILGQIRDHTLLATVRMQSNRAGIPGLPVSPLPLCLNKSTPNHVVLKNDPNNALDCWMMALEVPMDKTTKTPEDQIAFASATRNLLSQNVKMPFMVVDKFFIATKERYVSVNYSFSPHMIDSRTPVTYEAPAHGGKLGMFEPDQIPAATAIRDWGKHWHDIVKKGFDGALPFNKPVDENVIPEVTH